MGVRKSYNSELPQTVLISELPPTIFDSELFFYAVVMAASFFAAAKDSDPPIRMP